MYYIYIWGLYTVYIIIQGETVIYALIATYLDGNTINYYVRNRMYTFKTDDIINDC